MEKTFVYVMNKLGITTKYDWISARAMIAVLLLFSIVLACANAYDIPRALQFILICIPYTIALTLCTRQIK